MSAGQWVGEAWRRVVFFVALLVFAAGCGQGAQVEPPTPTAPESTVTELTELAAIEIEVFRANDQLGDPCGEVFPVVRRLAADDQVGGAVRALLAGPTAAEEAEGYGGWFSERTADMLRSVRVEVGVARVDFKDLASVIPSTSSSCGSAALLAQLDKRLL